MKLSAKISSLFLFVLLAGCNKHFKDTITNTSSNDVRKDSISYIERLRVDTVVIPGDTVQVSVPVMVDCPDGAKPEIKQTVINTEGKRSSIHIKIDSSGQLTASADCDALQQLVFTKDTQIKQLESDKDSLSQTSKTTITIQVKYIPKAYKWAMGFSIIWILILIGYGVFKLNSKFHFLKIPL
jgi:hypothetical protein